MKKVAHSKIKLKFVWENFISTLKARSFRVIFVQQILTEYLPCIKHCWRHRLYNSESNWDPCPSYSCVCVCVYIEVGVHNKQNIGKKIGYMLANVEKNLRMYGGGDRECVQFYVWWSGIDSLRWHLTKNLRESHADMWEEGCQPLHVAWGKKVPKNKMCVTQNWENQSCLLLNRSEVLLLHSPIKSAKQNFKCNIQLFDS